MKKSGMRTRPYALRAEEGWTYRVFGARFILKSSEVQEGSGSAVVEYTTKKGGEPQDHTHPTEDEMFYVLDGIITFRCGGESFDLEKGGFVFLPRGIEHGYTIRSDGPVRLLVITSPVRAGVCGGWGGFVAEHMESGRAKLIRKPALGSGRAP